MRADLRSRAHALLDLVLDAIEEPRVAESETYDSRSLPPRTTRRTFHEACRTLPGAVKEGRVWRIRKDEWHGARARRSVAPALRLVESAKCDEERADDMIRAAGYRLGGRK